MKINIFLILFSSSLFAQPWYYDFGIGTGSHTIGFSETFLPTPQTNGGTARVRVGTGSGSFNLENQSITFGEESYLRAVAPTGSSVNKFSIYDYTPGKAFTIQFTIRFGAVDGSATGAESGNWYFFAGDGTGFSDNSGFTGSQVFTGVRWAFGTLGSITTNVRVAGAWTASGISGTPFTQGNTYTVDIYGNNTTTSATYTYGSSQSVAANTMDVWVNGSLIADDIGKALLPGDSNIDSYMFYGESSTGNVANIFLDDIYYTNAISDTVLPVELSSFTAKVLKSGGVKLDWRTETEVNNYGFEILRGVYPAKSGTQNDKWEKIGFVAGNGNSNSPKDYTFTDNLTLTRTLYYRLKQIDTDGQFEYSKVIEVDAGIIPAEIVLEQNYPNPFNPSTTIRFNLTHSGDVRLSIYNLLGEQIMQLVNGFLEAGIHTVNFNASDLNSGVYLYKFETNGIIQSRKMILAK